MSSRLVHIANDGTHTQRLIYVGTQKAPLMYDVKFYDEAGPVLWDGP